MPKVAPFRAKKAQALEAVKAAVSGLSAVDVMEVLTHQLSLAVEDVQRVMSDPREMPTVMGYRGRGRVSSIEKDPEIETFILQERGYRSLDDLQALCVERFGKARAPSRSALGRYTRKMKYRGQGDRYDG